MSYITIDNINSINAELSNYCNAACPMCARYDWGIELVKDKTNNSYTSLDLIKNKIGEKILKRLKKFYSCGTYGDGATNPECLEIFSYIRSLNSQCDLTLHTNGGARSTNFFKGLAENKVNVVFAIDGLENTNHLYRRNVHWNKLIENIQAFINAGGFASWSMLLFKHNQHQIEEAKSLSKKLGFKTFATRFSSRWKDFDSHGNFRNIDKIKVDNYYLEKPQYQPYNVSKIIDTIKFDREKEVKNNFMSQKISCASCSKGNYEIYLMSNGYVSPCCYVGDLDQHEPKNIIKNFDKVNLNKTTLEEILNGDFFKELERGIQGVPGSYRLQSCYWTCKTDS
jgi:MoaA/NifB/PqqE/SkfB family radical SAM enzyme